MENTEGNGGPQADCFDERELPQIKRELKEKKYIHRWMSAGGLCGKTQIIRTLFINSGAHQATQVLHTFYIFSGVHQATQVLRTLFINSGAHQATQVSDD